MQRVIRTDFYFPPNVEIYEESDFAISIAWLYTKNAPNLFKHRWPFRPLLAYQADHQRGIAHILVERTQLPPLPHEASLPGPQSIESLIRYFKQVMDAAPEGPFIDLTLLVELLDETVIVERSPPEAIPLRVILGHATQISIGAYLGAQAAENSHLLMLATVPAGIIIIGSAVGVSEGLRKGLNKSIARLVRRSLGDKRKK